MGMPKFLSAKATLLGFDYGTKRIGVCVGQMVTCTASPLPILQVSRAQNPPWEAIKILISEWQPEALVVGLPTMMNGSEQQITQKTKNFTMQLQKRFELPVLMADERLTTKSVRTDIFDTQGYQGLKKAPIDSLAAVVLLTQWMKAYAKTEFHND